MNYKNHTACRVCDSESLTEYIDLGMLPLSNNLCADATEVADTYPLRVMLCEDCGLSQLSIVVDPEIMFSHYVYRSSISQGYVDHCRRMAKDLKQVYGLTADSFHIDIAGNDGALLKEFKDKIGLRVLNIDPAKNLYKINEDQGIRMYNVFWGVAAANHLVNTHWPKADLITATNVFAHVDNVRDFMAGIVTVLKPTGVLVLEFPYLIDFIKKGEFDTIYFEHLSYFSIWPLVRLCNEIGLTVMRVEKQDIHGGSVRVHIGYGESDKTVRKFFAREHKYREIDLYNKFAEKAYETINKFWEQVKGLSNVAGFAASAKGNTLLNCAGITSEDMKYIVDETPEKIGKFSPGTHIPIVPISELKNNPPDYLVILSWNFADEIKAKCLAAGYKGEFIIPIIE